MHVLKSCQNHVKNKDCHFVIETNKNIDYHTPSLKTTSLCLFFISF